jgi:hypothetical protein
MESHIRLPVMKLPGIRFIPCPANTPPMITAIKPMVMRAMRPKLLFTLPNLPLTSSRLSESALAQGCTTYQCTSAALNSDVQRRLRSGLRAGTASREVVAQSLEQAAGAFLTALPFGPELVEEDAVLDVREPGALVYGLEL